MTASDLRTGRGESTRRTGITVFVEVRLSARSAGSLRAFERAISRLPPVVEGFLMTGDADYLLRVVAADVRSFHGFLDTTLRRIEGVLATKSSIAMRQVKRPFRYDLKARARNRRRETPRTVSTGG